MADLTVRVDADAGIFDSVPLELTSDPTAYNGLVVGGDLETAVLASLFTWARADDAAELPDGGDDRKGWWGDAWPAKPSARVGSRLWLLARRVLNNETMEMARQYATEALQWLIDDGYAATVDVTISRVNANRMNMIVNLTRPDGRVAQIRLADLWGEIGGVI